ncbi:MAG: amino acid ABC transporter substrate-binding protein [Actinobacteria bacterium]|nr:amino acid ABC transporter substrate-binding protein [Actinomycetota bacterium]
MVVLVLTLLAAACGQNGDQVQVGETQAQGEQQPGRVLQTVQERGTLNCGVNDSVPGFGFVDEEGNFSGFDIDFCRVIAAAVLGDAEAVSFTPLTAQQRFTALQTGEIDVLVRNTTWTATRDGSEGGAFAVTTYYDGQGMMVRADSPAQTLEDLDGATVCVLSGTTTELNLETNFAARGLDYTPASFEDNETLQQAFEQGQCDAWTSDKSQLAGVRSDWPEGPEALRILDVTMSKEPLGPAVRDGDPDWFDAVNWAMIATMQAEEFGIDSTNVDQRRDQADDPDVRNFLGDLDAGLGLPSDFAYQVVSQVGNYGEIYERNVGSEGIGLERCPSPEACLNELWNEGGLHYPPPYR